MSPLAAIAAVGAVMVSTAGRPTAATPTAATRFTASRRVVGRSSAVPASALQQMHARELVERVQHDGFVGLDAQLLRQLRGDL